MRYDDKWMTPMTVGLAISFMSYRGLVGSVHALMGFIHNNIETLSLPTNLDEFFFIKYIPVRRRCDNFVGSFFGCVSISDHFKSITSFKIKPTLSFETMKSHSPPHKTRFSLLNILSYWQIWYMAKDERTNQIQIYMYRLKSYKSSQIDHRSPSRRTFIASLYTDSNIFSNINSVPLKWYIYVVVLAT